MMSQRRTSSVAMVDWQERSIAVQMLLDCYAQSHRFQNELESLAADDTVKRISGQIRHDYHLVKTRNPLVSGGSVHSVDNGESVPLLVFCSLGDFKEFLSDEQHLVSDALRDYVEIIEHTGQAWGLHQFPEGHKALHEWIESRAIRGIVWKPHNFGYELGFLGDLPATPELDPIHRTSAGFQPVWRATHESRDAAVARITREFREWLPDELDAIAERYVAAGYSFADSRPSLERNVKWLYHTISAERRTAQQLSMSADPPVSAQTVRNQIANVRNLVCSPPSTFADFPV